MSGRIDSPSTSVPTAIPTAGSGARPVYSPATKVAPTERQDGYRSGVAAAPRILTPRSKERFMQTTGLTRSEIYQIQKMAAYLATKNERHFSEAAHFVPQGEKGLPLYVHRLFLQIVFDVRRRSPNRDGQSVWTVSDYLQKMKSQIGGAYQTDLSQLIEDTQKWEKAFSSADFSLSEDINQKVKGDYGRLKSFVERGNFSDLRDADVEDIFIRVVSDANYAQLMRAQLSEEALTLEREEKYQLLDFLYLALFDTRKEFPSNTAAGEMKYVIVADKGEMGVRITCAALAQRKTPLIVHNTSDANVLQVRMAKKNDGDTISLGEGTFSTTYPDFRLISRKVIEYFQNKFGENWRAELARASLHPGYGPLAENDAAIAHFRQQGIIFNGPTADTVRAGGDKRFFRDTVKEVLSEMPEFSEGGLTVGFKFENEASHEILSRISSYLHDGQLRFPIRLKAANGGGGRGQIVVERREHLRGALDQVLAEIGRNSWAPGILVEENISNTIHLELQVLRDRYGKTIVAGLRDCSEQREGQKIQEEAPPAILQKFSQLTQKLTQIARQLADKFGYVGVGTIECMYKDGKVYLLEMNTRTQVEHCITEQTTYILREDGSRERLDIVGESIRIAGGLPISFNQNQLIIGADYGREFRLNSERFFSDEQKPSLMKPNPNPKGYFKPNTSPFRFTHFQVPTADEVLKKLWAQYPDNAQIQQLTAEQIHIRLDTGFETGDILPNDRDPTFAKLIITVDGNVPNTAEVHRLVSVATLELTKIEGEFTHTLDPRESSTSAAYRKRLEVMGFPRSDIDRAVALYDEGKSDEIKLKPHFNLADHIRVLKARVTREHVRGIDTGRHVNWVNDFFRNGDVWDRSYFPAALKEAPETARVLGVARVVHSHNRDTDELPEFWLSNADEDPLQNPSSYDGSLAQYLSSLSSLNAQSLFGVNGNSKKMSVHTQVNSEKELMSVSLHDESGLPYALLLNLDFMDLPFCARIDFRYEGTQVKVKVVSLKSPEEATREYSIDLLSSKKGSLTVPVPGSDESFILEYNLREKNPHLTVRSKEGDRILQMRRHMAMAHTDRFISILKLLSDFELTPVQANEYRAQLRHVFTEMVLLSQNNPQMREELVKGLARSPYSLTAEMAPLVDQGNALLNGKVRDLAMQVLAYRYYDTHFHRVVSGSYRAESNDNLSLATLDFRDREGAILPSIENNRRMIVLSLPQNFESAENNLRIALNKAKENFRGRDTKHDVVELFLPQWIEKDDDFVRELEKITNEVFSDVVLRRVTFNIGAKEGDLSAKPGEACYTLRLKEGRYQELTEHSDQSPVVPRHVHPMLAERTEMWRFAQFHSQYNPTGVRGVNATRITARENPKDVRYVVDGKVDQVSRFDFLPKEFMSEYVTAVVENKNGSAIIEKYFSSLPSIPDDLQKRVEQYFIYQLYLQGKIVSPQGWSFDLLGKSGILTQENISSVAAACDSKPFYARGLEAMFDDQVRAFEKLMKNHSGEKPQNNRLRVFIENPLDPRLDAEFFSFLVFSRASSLWPFHLEKVTFKVVRNGSAIESEREEIIKVGSIPGALSYSDKKYFEASVVPVRREKGTNPTLIRTLSANDVRENQIRSKGNLLLREKLEELFDAGSFKELIPNSDTGILEEKPYVPFAKSYHVRGFVGLIGGRRTYVVCADPLLLNKDTLGFNSPEGQRIKAFIDRARQDRDENGDLVNAGVIKIEELSAGAKLHEKDRSKEPSWAGTDPLDSYGHEFEARYNHARLSEAPNLTLLTSLVIGGGIYGPEASHDVIVMEALAVAALTGGEAAAYATGAKPRLEDGKLKALGGSANFNHNVSGSTSVHIQNGVFTTLVSIPRIGELLKQGVPIHEIVQKLTASEKRLLQKSALQETRLAMHYLGDSVAHLVGTQYSPPGDESVSLSSSFSELMKALAAQDKDGNSLYRIWNQRFAPNLVCGWLVLPQTNVDGSVRYESVAFMLPINRNVSLSDAELRKAEEFLEVNSRLGRALIRTGDITSNLSEDNRPEQVARVLDKIANYRGAMVNLPSDTNAKTSQAEIARSIEIARQRIQLVNQVRDVLLEVGLRYTDNLSEITDVSQYELRLQNRTFSFSELSQWIKDISEILKLAGLQDRPVRVLDDGRVEWQGLKYAPAQLLQIFSLDVATLSLNSFDAGARVMAGEDPVSMLHALEQAISVLTKSDAEESLALPSESFRGDTRAAQRVKSHARNNLGLTSEESEKLAGMNFLSEAARRLLEGEIPSWGSSTIASGAEFSPAMEDYIYHPVLMLCAGQSISTLRDLIQKTRQKEIYSAILDIFSMGLNPDDVLPSSKVNAKWLNAVKSWIESEFHSSDLNAYLNSGAFEKHVKNKFGDAEASSLFVKWNKPGRPSSKPDFNDVLEIMAVKDEAGKPVVEYFMKDHANDLLCAWAVIPVEVSAGVWEARSVAFMMNDPKGANSGAITPDACRKAEMFLEMNSRTGRDFVMLSGSPGFLATDQAEKIGIEQMGKRAMDQVIAYQGRMYQLEILEDDGGARIFMASMSLRADGGRTTDALDHPAMRLAALPTRATAGVLYAGELQKIGDDQGRDAKLVDLAAATIAAGRPERAKQNGAVREIVRPGGFLKNLSSGLAHSGNQMARHTQIDGPLFDLGVLYKKVGESYRFADGRTLGVQEATQLVVDLQRARSLAQILDVKIQITAEGKIRIFNLTYDASEFVSKYSMAATLKARGETLSGAQFKNSFVQLHDSTKTVLEKTLSSFVENVFAHCLSWLSEGSSVKKTGCTLEISTQSQGSVAITLSPEFKIVFREKQDASLVNQLLGAINANLGEMAIYAKRSLVIVNGDETWEASRSNQDEPFYFNFNGGPVSGERSRTGFGGESVAAGLGLTRPALPIEVAGGAFSLGEAPPFSLSPPVGKRRKVGFPSQEVAPEVIPDSLGVEEDFVPLNPANDFRCGSSILTGGMRMAVC